MSMSIYEKDGFELNEFVPKRRKGKLHKRKDEIIRLIAEGKSQREIARVLKVDDANLWKYIQRNDLYLLAYLIEKGKEK